MKVRQGFVSNSSSSSFIVNKEFLSPKQLEALWNHEEYINCINVKEKFLHNCENCIDKITCSLKEKYLDNGDQWSIEEQEHGFLCSTYMDNFYLDDFLYDIGVPKEAIIPKP